MLLSLLASAVLLSVGDVTVKESLIRLYDSTTGDEWSDRTNWKTNASVCQWFGVTCENNTVTELNLASNNLVGQLPVMNLSSVHLIDLSLNRLSGSIICSTFTDELRVLRLSSNSLTGSIPDCISRSTLLCEIEFDSNSLEGQIPNAITSLQRLRKLSITWDSLSGTLPEKMGNMTLLQYVYLGSNQISGSLPDLSSLTTLSHLWLDNNKLSGTIPSSLTKVAQLSELVLHDNLFVGAIPEFQLSQLQKCDLGGGFSCPLRAGYCPEGCTCIATCEESHCKFGQDCSLDYFEPVFISSILVVVVMVGLMYRRAVAAQENASLDVHNTPSQNQLPDRLKAGRWRVDVEKWTVDVQIVRKDDHRKAEVD
eukprot:TRINITY_DN31154_c0_g1_i1.p1 TRINITY_DN31154_c0_g1~~TRINITY_DN31154_c0_g1_i1.p1  ORF type:complete len:379 (+),score=48.14 TRINITY_DN31154_c0_g1_i1:39-1139(+)